MFHINPDTGNAAPCASKACSVAPHFETAEVARDFYEDVMGDHLFPRISKTPARTARPTLDMNASFAAFLTTDEAKPTPLELGDWRGDIARAAALNGDALADAQPETSTSGYADASVQEGDDDYAEFAARAFDRLFHDDDDELPEEFKPF